VSNVGLILLAAGGSSRLGTPKQLLEFDGSTLLERAFNTACESHCNPIVVVLGANANQMRSALATVERKPDSTVHLEENPNWSSGLSSSLRLGINKLRAASPHVGGAIIMTCDQPFVTTQILDKLVHQFSFSTTTCKIVASSYAGTLGVPALFSAALFDELVKLTGDSGAKALIRKHLAETLSIDFPQGTIDIDTTDDYKQLNSL
jgi:molybdenum cofactor cytidylyltransferase